MSWSSRIYQAVVATMLAMSVSIGAQAHDDKQVYELRSYVSEPGRQADVLKLIENDGVKFMKKHSLQLVGAWTPADKSDERVITLLVHKDKATCDANWTALQNDEDWKKALAASAVDGKRPVKSFERVFMTATDYSPHIEAKQVGDRVFELRTYITTPNHLPNLNSRFRDHTVKLFEKHGITNVAYWTVLDGEKLTAAKLLEAVSPVGQASAEIDANLPATGNSLVYFITHKSADAAKASFGAFGGDPDWKKALKESEAAAGGPLTAAKGVKSLFLVPTSFSPIR